MPSLQIPSPSWRSLITFTLALAITNPLTSASPLSKRQYATVEKAANPVVIDPNGVYIRASPLKGDGWIIAGYAATEGSEKILRASKSTDNAQSWTFVGEVARANDTTRDLDNAMPLQLASGRIVYAYRNHDRTGPDTYSYYRITISYSDDGGKSWEFLSQVVERAADTTPGQKNGFWEPFLRVAGDGTLQAYYSSEKNDAEQDNLMRYSTDGGVTWSDEIIMVSEKKDARDGMTGVADVDGKGRLICVFESYQNGIFSIHRVLSNDDGRTWGQRSLVYTAANGKDAGAPQVYNVGGTLVTSFMTNEADDLAHLDGAQMKVVTSVNGAADWSSMTKDGYVTAGTGSHWPGLYTIDERHFLALYSRAGLGAVSELYKLD